jgi:hypothetical protein
METFHPEGKSPFITEDDRVSEKGKEPEKQEYAECPIEGCGEVLLVEDLNYHVELHAQENDMDSDEDGSTEAPPVEKAVQEPKRRQPKPPSAAESRQRKAISVWRTILSMPSSKKQAGSSSKEPVPSSVKVKRLGVRKGIPTCPLVTRLTCDISNRKRNSADLLTRTVCLTGL